WYHPNNAVLIVAGDVVPEEVFALAEQHFGSFEAVPVPARIRPDAERPFEADFETVTDALITKPSARRAWRLPEVVAETGVEAFRTRYAARLLSSMLTSGLDAPFTRYLQTERQIALSAGFSLVLDEGQDWAILSIEPVEGQDPVAVLDEAEDFLRNWLANDLTTERLERQKRRFVNGLVYAADSIDGPATSFESVVATNGDYGVFLTLEDTINSMTIDNIRAVAALFLDQASAPKTLVLGPLEE
ncbi:MAG: insulinase family protein, partial [Pseudomonadota bacterium]|nr:insulinase family protein [Pseudomonadota bacterium]